MLKGFCYRRSFSKVCQPLCFLPVSNPLPHLFFAHTSQTLCRWCFHCIWCVKKKKKKKREWKRERNPLWITAVPFSSVCLLFGPLGSVVYWCSSGTQKRKKKHNALLFSALKIRGKNARGEKKKRRKSDVENWEWRRSREVLRICREHGSYLDSTCDIFDCTLSHFKWWVC